MRILIVTPAASGSRQGNRITANRWRTLLRASGNQVVIASGFAGQACDVCIALHAKKSAASIHRFAAACPERPLIVALTGTDLYRDIQRSRAAQRSLDLADRLVLLQPEGVQALPQRWQGKARVIFQSVAPIRSVTKKLKSCFEVAVIGHLRAVKDPFRAALAARRLPPDSRVRISHYGRALSEAMLRQAEREMARNARYRWLGELPHGQTLRRLARSRLMVLSSKLEGGANVISEALACRVPILASRIAGTIGLLGDDYPGYFTHGETGELADLLRRAEVDPTFRRALKDACRKRRWLTEPRLERESWETLLAEFSNGSAARVTPPRG